MFPSDIKPKLKWFLLVGNWGIKKILHLHSSLTPKLSDKSNTGQDQLTPALSDASIITAPNQTSFTGNHDSGKGDSRKGGSSDSEGSNDIKVLSNIRTKFAK